MRPLRNGRPAPERKTFDDDGFLCLTGVLLWKYRAVDAEYRNALFGRLSKETQILDEVEKHEVLRGLMNERKALLNEASVRAAELQLVRQEIEKTLGISLQNCAIDDATGRIYLLGREGAHEPIRPQPKRTTVPRAAKRPPK